MPNVRDWAEFQYWAQQLLAKIEGMGSPGRSPNLSGNVAWNLGVRPRAAPMPNMRDPAAYLGFFAGTLDCALFPHLSRRPLAPEEAWKWIQGQLRDGVRNPEWRHEDTAGKIGIILDQLFHRIGDRGVPKRLGPKMSYELHELWRLESERQTRVDVRSSGQKYRSREEKMDLGDSAGRD